MMQASSPAATTGGYASRWAPRILAAYSNVAARACSGTPGREIVKHSRKPSAAIEADARIIPSS